MRKLEVGDANKPQELVQPFAVQRWHSNYQSLTKAGYGRRKTAGTNQLERVSEIQHIIICILLAAARRMEEVYASALFMNFK